MPSKSMAIICLFLFCGAAQAETLEKLAVGCRTPTHMDVVLRGFQSGDGPERLTELVRQRECRWLEPGTVYSFTPAPPTDVARQIRIADGSTYWVLSQFVGRSTGQEGRRPEIDDETFFALATMKAIFVYAAANCGGRPSPIAAKAMELATEHNPVKMRFALDQIGASIKLQGEKRGVREQCKSIVEAYGPRGSVQAGAWLPGRR